MSALDYGRAVTVGFVVFAGTRLVSIPMVVVYAPLVNPGHPPECYRSAATWIAPWLSHVGGYVVMDRLSVPIVGLTLSAVVTMAIVVSLAVKSGAALAGATLGSRRPGTTRMRTALG